MDNLWTYLSLVLVAWGIVNLLVRNPRIAQLGIDTHLLYITYRTQRLNELIREIAERKRFFFRVTGNLGVAFGIGLTLFTAYFLTANLIRLYYKSTIAVLLTPVLPGITISLRETPYLLISVAITLLLHETSHAMVAWSEGIPIKNAGLFLAVLIPGAFVEIDDEKFASAGDLSKLRVLSAGPIANLATAMVCIILLSNFLLALSPLYETFPSGVLIVDVTDGGPAEKSGLTVGDVIYEVNGKETKTLAPFSIEMSRISSGDTVEMMTSIGRVTVETITRGAKAIIGVVLSEYYCPKMGFLENRFGRQIPYHLLMSVFWTYSIGLSTAMFNMLPMYPFDGDQFLKVVAERIAGKRASGIRRVCNAAFLGLMLANMMFSFMRIGLATI